MDNQIQAQYNEHHFKRIIPGDLESVRLRLASVLADFDYDVLSEQPLQARRIRKKNLLAATLLEQNTRLTIALKPLNPVSTLATFDYSIQFLTTQGDCQTLEREADAIIAMAKTIDSLAVCPACNTENSRSIRFCRVCGVPASRNQLPAEMEVMRLTDKARSSYQEITLGIFVAVATFVVSLVLLLFGKSIASKAFLIPFTIGSVLSTFLILWGLRRLHLTLNSQNGEQNQDVSNAAQAFPESRPSGYLLESEPASVTEGTTRMMDNQQKEPASSQAKMAAKTTDPMD